MARHMDIPEPIIAKAPSADLWRGQTDEGELGFSYDDADQVLYLLTECGKAPDEIAARGFAPETVAAGEASREELSKKVASLEAKLAEAEEAKRKSEDASRLEFETMRVRSEDLLARNKELEIQFGDLKQTISQKKNVFFRRIFCKIHAHIN